MKIEETQPQKKNFDELKCGDVFKFEHGTGIFMKMAACQHIDGEHVFICVNLKNGLLETVGPHDQVVIPLENAKVVL